MTHMESYPAWVWSNQTMKSIPISSHFHSRIFNGCNSPAGLWCSILTRWHVSHNDTYFVISRFMPYHQYLVFKSLYILVLPVWIEYAESWASRRINSQIGFRLGTHIYFPNHKVPLSSLVKSLVLFSFISCRISLSFPSSSWAFLISDSNVGSTSIAIVASFTIARLWYLISWHSSGRILLAKVVLQYFLWLKASATTLAFPGW
jgi:hypothetical protein